MQHNPKMSYWELKSFFQEVDHVIIGAGIVGYSTALHLRKGNPTAKIVVLERGLLPSGASTKNAGFACFGSATELAADLRKGDSKQVWETLEWRWKGLKALRSLIGDKELNFQRYGSWDLITSNDTKLFDETADQLEHFNHELKSITGEDQVYTKDPLVGQRFGFKGVTTSFYNHLEGQIDTAQMNSAFYRMIIAANIHVLFGMDVLEIEDRETNVLLRLNDLEMLAKNVFICTNGFAAQFISDEIILPARAQVLITRPIPGLKLQGTFHYQEGYYYFRNIDNRILFGGGRNLDMEGETNTELTTTPHIMARLEELLHTVISPNTPFEIEHRWAGIMGVGTHKQPIIRQLSENVYCGVRLGGMGVAIGTLVGQELAAFIKS